MKKVLILLAIMLPIIGNAQNKEEKKLTKFEEFASKTGSIIKFVDVSMPNIPLIYGSVKTGIRTVLSSQGNAYFYRIEQEETSRSIAHIAMIEYSDLVEVNKAIDKLLGEVDSDIQSNPDYLENKFVTEDGLQVGYYVSKEKASWYIKLERYGSSTIFVKDPNDLTTAFKNAQTKIEELKG